MSHRVLVLLFGACISVSVFEPVHAQFCWNPRPTSDCRIFPVTQFGVQYRVSRSPVASDTSMIGDSVSYVFTDTLATGVQFTSDLGFMQSVSKNYAIGASSYFGLELGGDQGLRGGFKFRVARWIGDQTRIDLSTGVLLLETSDHFNTPGFIATADWRTAEWFLITTSFEYLQGKHVENAASGGYRQVYRVGDDLGFHVGLKLGSYAGLIGHGVGVVAIALVALALTYSGD